MTIGNLRVIVTRPSTNLFFGQGLEIDLPGRGPTLEAMQSNFEQGLALMLIEERRRYMTTTSISPAPARVASEYIHGIILGKLRVSECSWRPLPQLSLPKGEIFPYEGIDYYVLVPTAALIESLRDPRLHMDLPALDHPNIK